MPCSVCTDGIPPNTSVLMGISDNLNNHMNIKKKMKKMKKRTGKKKKRNEKKRKGMAWDTSTAACLLSSKKK